MKQESLNIWLINVSVVRNIQKQNLKRNAISCHKLISRYNIFEKLLEWLFAPSWRPLVD